jgi:outer membrane lipoprotein SlyB
METTRMSLIANWNSTAKSLTLFSAALACALLPSDRAAAQHYYYQPAPDYYHNDTASGTVMGGAFGAVTGAIIGGRKDRGEGALIGAGVGAVTGNLLGRAKDRADQRQAATGAAVVAHANQQAASMAVTNYDLVTMCRAGVSEDVIISTMRSRGTQLDLSPQSLISLKQSGVSDRVLLAAQDLNRGPAYLPPPATVHVVEPAPRTVIVTPGWRSHWYHHPHHHYHRSRVYYYP